MAEPAHTSDGWTFRTFREFMLAKFEILTALREADRITLNAALAAADRAVAKAEAANEKRFEGVNEFRKTLSDQAATFPTRSEVEARMVALGEKIGDLQIRVEKSEASRETEHLTKREQKTDIGNLLGYVFGAVGAAAYVWSLFQHH